MPLYDFACRNCGRVWEAATGVDEAPPACPSCAGRGRRLPSFGAGRREDADWIESVRDVVDKDNPAPHVQAFLAEPNRKTYAAWMRGEGLRPLERGEGKKRPPETDALRREALERFKARRGL